MKKSIGLIAVAFVALSTATMAQTQTVNVNPLYSLATVTVDTFEGAQFYPGTQDAIEWSVVASRRSADGFPQIEPAANTWPRDKFGENPANAAELRSLGIHASFTARGDNWLEIRPGRAGSPEPLPLDGRVEVLSMWVWGSGFNYDLDVVFLDANGIEHRVRMGNLNFMGWRHMSAVVPRGANQVRTAFPFPPALRLSKFLLTTNARERADGFFIYFDEISVLTHQNLFQSFDGANLTEQQVVSQIWGDRATRPNPPIPAPTPAEPGAFPPSATSPLSNPGVGTDNPAFQQLQELSVSKMEEPVFWQGRISSDFGIISLRALQASPAGKQPIADAANAANTVPPGPDERVLGLRVNFHRRGATDMTFRSVRPLPVEGIVKAVSVWVAGRNAPHRLFLIVRDFNGNLRELEMGSLDFAGWRQMSVAIPPTIVQQDPFADDRAGMSIEGFRVAFSLADTAGSYFIYFDDLRALADLYPVSNGRQADNPADDW
jgi:hypothetical protein